MPRFPSIIQIINDQCKCVHPTFGHPKIKTRRKKIVTNSRFGKTCKFMVFLTIEGKT
jgi:hypothetical protein